jgi:hypothetical protein
MKKEIIEYFVKFLENKGFTVELTEPNWDLVKMFPVAWVEMESDSVMQGLHQTQVHKMSLSVFFVNRVIESASKKAILELIDFIEDLENTLQREVEINGVITKWKYVSSRIRSTQTVDINFALVGAVLSLEVIYTM